MLFRSSQEYVAGAIGVTRSVITRFETYGTVSDGERIDVLCALGNEKMNLLPALFGCTSLDEMVQLAANRKQISSVLGQVLARRENEQGERKR